MNRVLIVPETCLMIQEPLLALTHRQPASKPLSSIMVMIMMMMMMMMMLMMMMMMIMKLLGPNVSDWTRISDEPCTSPCKAESRADARG